MFKFHIKFFIIISILFLSACEPQNPTILSCRQQGGIEKSLNCITDLAIKSKIISLCDYAVSKSKDCQEKVLASNSKMKCQSDQCVLNTATSALECSKIKISILKNECLGKFLNKNEGVINCKNEKAENQKYLCLASLAYYQKDAEICKNITNTENPVFLKNCLLRASEETNKETLTCDSINDKNEKMNCLSEVGLKQDFLPIICEEMKENSSFFNNCLENLARSKKDCAKINDKNLEKSCLKKLKIQEIDVLK